MDVCWEKSRNGRWIYNLLFSFLYCRDDYLVMSIFSQQTFIKKINCFESGIAACTARDGISGVHEFPPV